MCQFKIQTPNISLFVHGNIDKRKIKETRLKSYIGLRLVYCYIDKHTKIIQRKSDKNCDQCHIPETVEQYMLECLNQRVSHWNVSGTTITNSISYSL